MNIKKTRKGFTLVELLIVIVVIGILSAMMMLSSTEAVTSARASNIVSNLRNLKTAALAYYVDNMDALAKKDPATDLSDIWPYMNNNKTNGTYDIPDSGSYKMVLEGNTAGQKTWFLSYTITGTTAEIGKIKEKLKGRAKSVGLLKEAKTASEAYNGDATVYVLVR